MKYWAALITAISAAVTLWFCDMKQLLASILLITTAAFSQPVAITIDRINTSDTVYSIEPPIKSRRFLIDFTIKNTSNETVAFYLNPSSFVPAQAGAGSNSVFYKIYEQDHLIEISSILTQPYEIRTFGTPQRQLNIDSIRRTMNISLEQRRETFQKELLNSMITVKPGEQRSYKKVLSWDFERYKKQDDIEFYFDDTKKYYMELLLIFLREEYESRLTPDQYQLLLKNKSLIKGWCLSNKMELDFSPIRQ